jgi:hypothetical protein
MVLGSSSRVAPKRDDQRGRENASANHIKDQQGPIATHFPFLRCVA